MASQHVLILTSNTGGGHRSAARALESSLHRLSPGGGMLVRITQVLEEAHYLTRKAAELYNFLLRDHQDLMRYYFWAVHKIKPNESRLLFKSAMGYGLRLFEKVMPHVIVSVHPMTQHFFAHILRRLHLQDKIPLLTVVTDPYHGFWKGWACEDVSQYYVASNRAKQQLIDFGVDAGRIQVAGMPVDSRFSPPSEAERQAQRQRLGLHPDKFTVFINAGWIGGGNIPRLYETLIRSSDTPGLDRIQVVFLAGKNESLRLQALETAKAARFPVKVLGYSQEMDGLMKASDIMVSKLGGLTTFEALSCHLPILADTLTPPMPQESQTAAFLEDSGAGLLLRQPEEILSVVKSLVDTPSLYQALRSAAGIHGRPGAADQIARDVLRYLNPEVTTSADFGAYPIRRD